MIKHTKGPWKIDGAYVVGTDIGPRDGISIFEACCCGRIPGENAEETEGSARILVAALKMYELTISLSQAYDHNKPSHDLAATLYDLRCKALQLLAKIEGGEG